MKDKNVPELTKQTIEDLFGVSYENIVAYNHLDRSVSPYSPLGIVVAGYPLETIAYVAQLQIEKMPQMQGRYLVLSAVRGIPKDEWIGPDEFQTAKFTDNSSTRFAGNMIVFNPKTNLFEANPAGWYGVKSRPLLQSGKYNGLHNFLFRMWLWKNERAKFVAPYEKQK